MIVTNAVVVFSLIGSNVWRNEDNMPCKLSSVVDEVGASVVDDDVLDEDVLDEDVVDEDVMDEEVVDNEVFRPRDCVIS